MNKFYLMSRKISSDGTSLDQRSHYSTLLKSGFFLPKDFCGPLVCDIDTQCSGDFMPTFYMSPAIIGTKQFYQDLLDCGINNIEAQSVVINDTIKKTSIDNYVFLNIIGRISCADMEKSEYGTIGEGMHIMNKLVINLEKACDFDLFLVDEDTNCIVISEKVYKHLNSKGYTDISFEELEHT